MRKGMNFMPQSLRCERDATKPEKPLALDPSTGKPLHNNEIGRAQETDPIDRNLANCWLIQSSEPD